MNARKFEVAQARPFVAKIPNAPKIRQGFMRFSVAGMSMVMAAAANAADWSTVTGGLDFSGEITGVIAVVGVLAGFYVVRKGARLLLSMIK
tara:strand:- start:6381 stop:6653 length:273 start_codon:yes stop_codon:yes gene_type:complete